MKLKSNTFYFLLIALLPFIYWLFNYLNADLWYDEISTFESFIFTDFGYPLTHYPYPNNHVFYSILTQCLAVIVKCDDFYFLFDHVYIFRIFQALITLTTALYSYRILNRFFNLKLNILVILFLFTTIPFMNFSLQLRGYNMSSTLLVMLLFHAWSYIQNPKLWSGILTVLLSALLLYTIPSNLYALASIILSFGIIWLIHKRKKKKDSRSYFYATILIGAGIIISIIFYLPIIKDVVFNDFSIKRPEDIWYSMKLIPLLLNAFLSNRWILLVFFIIGSWYFVKTVENHQKERYFTLIGILIIPFILSFIHQRFPFERVFVLLAPIFCIVVTISIDSCFSLIKSRFTSIALTYVVSIYCLGTFYLEIKSNDRKVKANLDKAQTTQNVYENYFLSEAFHPSQTADFIDQLKDYDTLIKYDQLDFPSINWYFHAKGIEFTQVNSATQLDSLASTVNKALVITSFENKTLHELRAFRSLDVRVINDEHSFTSVIELKKKQVKAQD